MPDKSRSGRAPVLIGAIVLAVVAGVGAWLALSAGEEDLEAQGDEAEDELEGELGFWLGPEEPRGSVSQAQPSEDQAEQDGERGRWRGMFDPDSPEAERWRERRERWRNMTPEERRERFARRVQITSLGDSEPEISAKDLHEGFRESRRKARDCIRNNGGFRALRRAMSSSDAGARGRRSLSFEITPEGAVEGLTFQPTPPEPFGSCLMDSFQGITFPSPGADGVEVEMRMGRGGRRGGRRDEGGGDMRAEGS